MNKAALLSGILLILVLSGCGHAPADTAIDMQAARKLSDAFMADLIAHRSDAALDKMEPQFIGMVNRSDFPSQLERLFQYCGWPLDSELKDIQDGVKVYPDLHKNPLRKFIYAATTSQAPKGQCYFSVDVVPNGSTLKVTSFGPLKVTSGKPYP
ncbi:MAG: hypothetical protein WAM58_09265 [Candidatus Acidiferrum sp.]